MFLNINKLKFNNKNEDLFELPIIENPFEIFKYNKVDDNCLKSEI